MEQVKMSQMRQFHVRLMWKIQIFKKWLDIKSYPVLYCWQVIHEVHRKISFSLLVIATHSGGVSKVSVYLLIINNGWETNYFNWLYKIWKWFVSTNSYIRRNTSKELTDKKSKFHPELFRKIVINKVNFVTDVT